MASDLEEQPSHHSRSAMGTKLSIPVASLQGSGGGNTASTASLPSASGSEAGGSDAAPPTCYGKLSVAAIRPHDGVANANPSAAERKVTPLDIKYV